MINYVRSMYSYSIAKKKETRRRGVVGRGEAMLILGTKFSKRIDFINVSSLSFLFIGADVSMIIPTDND